MLATSVCNTREEQQDAIEGYLRWRNAQRSITTRAWHQFKTHAKVIHLKRR